MDDNEVDHADLPRELAELRAELHRLEESNRNFEEALNGVSDLFVRFDPEWRYTLLNKKAAAFTGHEPQELVGKNIWELFPAAVGTPFWTYLQEAAATGAATTFESYYAESERWYEHRAFPSTQGLSLLSADITEKKQAEDRLRRSQSLLADAQRLTHVGSWEWDYSSSTLACSDEMCRLFDIEPAHLGGDCDLFLERVHPEDHARVVAINEQIRQDHSPREYFYRVVHRDGTVRFLHARGQAAVDATGHTVRLMGVAQDITERRRIEEALEASQRRFQAVFENTLDGILLADDDCRYVDVNPAICAMLGYRREELLQLGVTDLTPPEHRARIPELWSTFLAEGTLSGEYTMIDKGGATRQFEYRSVANILPGLHLAVHRDITKRKRAEEKLRQSEQRLAEAQQVAHIGSWERDLRTNEVTWSDELYRLFGLQPQECAISYEKFLSIVLSEDRERIRQVGLQEMLEGQPFDCEYRVLASDGTTRILHDRGEVIRDADGKPVRVVGTAQDITERKWAEEELRRRNEVLQTIFDHIPVMINFIDPSGRVQLVNRHWEAVLGWTLAEARQMDLIPEFYPDEAERQRVIDVVRHPPSGWTDFKTRVRDNRVLDTSWALIVLSDGTRIGIGQDITERKRAEEALEKHTGRLQALSRRLVKLQEEERRNLARELHDEIGQILAGLKFTLEANTPPSAESVNLNRGEPRRLIEEVLTRIRAVSFDLRPALLDSFGLVPALRSLIERYTADTRIRVNFEQTGCEERLAPELETTAYRIVQQALINVARHSQAPEATVRLRIDAPYLIVQVEDQGVGFDPQAILAAGRAEGLTGMHEHAMLLGGRFTIDAAPGSGTHLSAELPLDGDTGRIDKQTSSMILVQSRRGIR